MSNQGDNPYNQQRGAAIVYGGTYSGDPDFDEVYALKKANWNYAAELLIWSIISFIVSNIGFTWITTVSNVEGETTFDIGASFATRISYALFIWYIVHCCATIGNLNLIDSCQFKFHTKWLLLHHIVLIPLIIVMMWLPNSWMKVMSKIAIVIAAIFLLLQLISLINFFFRINTFLIDQNWPDWILWVLFIFILGATLAFFICSFVFFKCKISHIVNSICLVASIIMVVIACYKEEAIVGSFFGFYTSYCCFIGFLCDPYCKGDAIIRWATVLVIISSIISLIWLVFSSLSLSKDNHLFWCFAENEKPDFNLAFFHLVYAFAALYFGVIVTNWGGNSPSSVSWELNMGRTAMWVNLSAAFGTVLIFVWILIAPHLCPNRVFPERPNE